MLPPAPAQLGRHAPPRGFFAERNGSVSPDTPFRKDLPVRRVCAGTHPRLSRADHVTVRLTCGAGGRWSHLSVSSGAEFDSNWGDWATGEAAGNKSSAVTVGGLSRCHVGQVITRATRQWSSLSAVCRGDSSQKRGLFNEAFYFCGVLISLSLQVLIRPSRPPV